MSDLTAEDYTRVAVAIGMRHFTLDLGGRMMWCHEARRCVPYSDLPAYLAEPAQMSRIMEELKGLPGHGWLIERFDDPDGPEWVVTRLGEDDDGDSWYFPRGAARAGEAVRDCAARALRPDSSHG